MKIIPRIAALSTKSLWEFILFKPRAFIVLTWFGLQAIADLIKVTLIVFLAADFFTAGFLVATVLGVLLTVSTFSSTALTVVLGSATFLVVDFVAVDFLVVVVLVVVFAVVDLAAVVLEAVAFLAAGFLVSSAFFYGFTT